jgi:hypothetical protein
MGLNILSVEIDRVISPLGPQGEEILVVRVKRMTRLAYGVNAH